MRAGWPMSCPDVDVDAGVPWGRLWAYEKQQGGYWDYASAVDVYGNGKTWVSVARPAQCSCRWPYNDHVAIQACPVCVVPESS